MVLSLVTDASLLPAPILWEIPALAREHVGSASTPVGILKPVHKETGRTKSRDLEHTSFIPPRPPPHCP